MERWTGESKVWFIWSIGVTDSLVPFDIAVIYILRSRVKMPPVLLRAYEDGSPFNFQSLDLPSLSADQVSSLVQWSDLILFDYLTGHYDRWATKTKMEEFGGIHVYLQLCLFLCIHRVASMQDGADHENRSSVMHENIRNLRQVWQSGKLWLIDNESGLRDAYELMFRGHDIGRKFIHFHEQMLKTLCIFRRRTVARIEALAEESAPHDILEMYAAAQEPMYSKMQWSKVGYDLFRVHFHERLKGVIKWVEKCRQLWSTIYWHNFLFHSSHYTPKEPAWYLNLAVPRLSG